MNERAMQFWVGLFVIVGLCLLMLLMSWFGDLPNHFKPRRYLKVAYPNAAGVGIGTPVQKSGLRVGEVVDLTFDVRRGHEDGVVVTLLLDRDFPLSVDSKPMIARGILGDTSIQIIQGMVEQPQPIGFTPEEAPLMEGIVRADPAKAVEIATEAIAKATNTLAAIDDAAKGIAKATQKFESAGDLLTSWSDTGKKIGTLVENVEKIVKENESEIKPMVANIRQAAERIQNIVDEETKLQVKRSLAKLEQAVSKVDDAASAIDDLKTLAHELGDTTNAPARTQLGQTIQRVNQISRDVSLLTGTLTDGNNRLNMNGSLQKMLTSPTLANNLNQALASVNELAAGGRILLEKLNRFSDKIANDPSAITRGVIQPR